MDPLRADTDGDGKLDKDEDEDASVNGASTGDRMVAFAEYRGVMWNGQHKRLDPTKKQLFVCGVDFAPGLFKFGNAFANAGIELLTIETKSNGANWSNFVKNFEDTKLDVLIIRSYPDGWSAGDYNTGHIRWIGVRKFDIPILGESYFGNSTQYGQPTKIYARSIGNYFNDRPYLDHSNYLPNILQMLDPLSKVEDSNDNGLMGKQEDVNRNGILDGDKLEMNVATWGIPTKLNPFDINNDGYVEFPQQTVNPTTIPAGVEYNQAAVFWHVITHEVGHAVGMGQGDVNLVDSLGHCFDSTCAMYHYSIDWKRADKFCPYHQSLIQIHNQ